MMHNLSDDRLELMSSYTSSDTSVPRIEITGHREYDYGSYQPWGWTSVYEQGGTAPVFQETYHTTPFPSRIPANVNMEMLRDLVNSVTQEMASKTYFQTQEQGAFILRKADGSLQVGTIEVGTTHGVSPSIDVYPGDKIVAMIHTHTPQPNTFVGIPSSPGNHEAGGKGDTADMVDM
jgi:SOS-response transcriptional repressor LexA